MRPRPAQRSLALPPPPPRLLPRAAQGATSAAQSSAASSRTKKSPPRPRHLPRGDQPGGRGTPPKAVVAAPPRATGEAVVGLDDPAIAGAVRQGGASSGDQGRRGRRRWLGRVAPERIRRAPLEPRGAGRSPIAAGRGRSPARATALILGGVLVGVAVLVVILSSLGGGSPVRDPPAGALRARSGDCAHAPASRTPRPERREPPQNLLPGGESGRNERRRAQRHGNRRPRPPGLGQPAPERLLASDGAERAPARRQPGHGRRVHERAPGRRPGRRARLGVSQVQPIEAAVSSLSPSATVVVIVGPTRLRRSAAVENRPAAAKNRLPAQRPGPVTGDDGRDRPQRANRRRPGARSRGVIGLERSMTSFLDIPERSAKPRERGSRT